MLDRNLQKLTKFTVSRSAVFKNNRHTILVPTFTLRISSRHCKTQTAHGKESMVRISFSHTCYMYVPMHQLSQGEYAHANVSNMKQ